ncbi:unnamed protein product [Clonostachys solani]|uniref:NTF2 domain-containing protein n=1 Tax=Clonostachys solani TaxID=160281 RepID=A0A9P0EMI3_9HYPO|nr:unnamed protein product [Clonostachys solani]
MATTGKFVEIYNATYDNNRAAISKYYVRYCTWPETWGKKLVANSLDQHPQAMLTFESENFVGSSAIFEKLNSLPFQQVQHLEPTVRVQPSVTDGFVLVMITGHFAALGLDNSFAYSQAFQLKVPDALDPNVPAEQNAEKFQICNDFFMLNFKS